MGMTTITDEEFIKKQESEIAALKKEIKNITYTNMIHMREIEDQHESDLEDASKSSDELLRIIRERFGRKVFEEITLELKTRRA